MKSLIGQQVGKYKIIENIGEGGMASVFKAYDEAIDRHVAMKVLVTDPVTESNRSKQMVERFQLEAKTIAKLQHPHILSIHDYGVQDNILYLIMPYIEGGTLKDRMVRDERLALGEVSKIMSRVASALDYAHRQDIIHRDIKPSNILLDDEENVMLADFGLAKLVSGDSNLTETGTIIGTPAYIAPEYASGMPMSHLSDIYALGITTFEAITGQTPYGDTSTLSPLQIVMQHLSEPVPDISLMVEDIPPVLNSVFAQVLDKNPEDRYQTATEFAEDLRDAIRGRSDEILIVPQREKSTPSPVTQVTSPSTESNQPSQPSIVLNIDKKAGWMTIAAAAVVVLAIVAVFLFTRSGGDDATDVAENDAPNIVNVPQDSTPNFGEASFLTTGGLGDTLSLKVNDFRTPPDGKRFYVWLTNTSSGESLLAGQLALDANGNGTVTYNHPMGLFLPAVFNAVIVTAEDEAVDFPSNDIYYAGNIPVEVSEALYNILLSAPDGINERGLLASIIAEAYLARQPYTVEGSLSSMARVVSDAESSLNAAFGTENDYNGDGVANNPGFGVGIPTVIDMINTQLDTIVSTSGEQLRIQTHAESIRTCLSNTTTRLNQLSELEEAILSKQDVDAVSSDVEDMTALLDEMMHGVDQNENGRIEGFFGECGLEQIAGLTLLIGSMDIEEQLESPLITADASFTPYEFVAGQDVCIDTELTIGVEKNTDQHSGM